MGDKAILFGINNYKSISDLRGCVNDVENICNLLVDEFGFSKKRIRKKTDSQVTRAAIEKDWAWLIKGAQPGDRLVFHFAGHGSYITDQDGDEDDGVDELLCLYDMDFDDEQSFIRDDQLKEMTEQIPDGVKLTMLLDCCHSGTGTRQILTRSLNADESANGMACPLVIEETTRQRAKMPEIKRAVESRTRSTRSTRSRTNANPIGADRVLARFIQPPSYAAKRMESRGVRGSMKRVATKMNHVLFSGCKAKQTSADAFIDSDFHGAFTNTFCKEIRAENGDIEQGTLIKRIRKSLAKGNFSQIPQLEPANTNAIIFDGLGDGDAPMPIASDSDSNSDSSSNTGQTNEMKKILKQMQDLFDQFQSMAGGGRTSFVSTNRTTNRAIVYVHGICKHSEGYSDKWYNALAPQLSRGLATQLRKNKHEVLWSHHVSDMSRSAESLDSFESEDLLNLLQDSLKDRADQFRELQLEHPGDRLERAERAFLGIPGLNCVDDFVKYLLSDTIRQNVIDEFRDVIEPLLRDGMEIEIVAHSWGTVVALEGLSQLNNRSFSGFVNNFFCVGSALSIRHVQRRLRFGAETGRKPTLVKEWYNLDAKGDIVGGTMESLPFMIDEEFLNLEPTNCGSFFVVSPKCAHSSYFDPDNVEVNRDIFAHFIE